MNVLKIAGQARHLIGAVGAAVASLGLFDVAVVQQATEAANNVVTSAQSLVGSVMVVVALVKSWTAPEKEVGDNRLPFEAAPTS